MGDRALVASPLRTPEALHAEAEERQRAVERELRLAASAIERGMQPSLERDLVGSPLGGLSFSGWMLLVETCGVQVKVWVDPSSALAGNERALLPLIEKRLSKACIHRYDPQLARSR